MVVQRIALYDVYRDFSSYDREVTQTEYRKVNMQGVLEAWKKSDGLLKCSPKSITVINARWVYGDVLVLFLSRFLPIQGGKSAQGAPGASSILALGLRLIKRDREILKR